MTETEGVKDFRCKACVECPIPLEFTTDNISGLSNMVCVLSNSQFEDIFPKRAQINKEKHCWESTLNNQLQCTECTEKEVCGGEYYVSNIIYRVIDNNELSALYSEKCIKESECSVEDHTAVLITSREGKKQCIKYPGCEYGLYWTIASGEVGCSKDCNMGSISNITIESKNFSICTQTAEAGRESVGRVKGANCPSWDNYLQICVGECPTLHPIRVFKASSGGTGTGTDTYFHDCTADPLISGNQTHYASMEMSGEGSPVWSIYPKEYCSYIYGGEIWRVIITLTGSNHSLCWEGGKGFQSQLQEFSSGPIQVDIMRDIYYEECIFPDESTLKQNIPTTTDTNCLHEIYGPCLQCNIGMVYEIYGKHPLYTMDNYFYSCNHTLPTDQNLLCEATLQYRDKYILVERCIPIYNDYTQEMLGDIVRYTEGGDFQRNYRLNQGKSCQNTSVVIDGITMNLCLVTQLSALNSLVWDEDKHCVFNDNFPPTCGLCQEDYLGYLTHTLESLDAQVITKCVSECPVEDFIIVETDIIFGGICRYKGCGEGYMGVIAMDCDKTKYLDMDCHSTVCWNCPGVIQTYIYDVNNEENIYFNQGQCLVSRAEWDAMGLNTLPTEENCRICYIGGVVRDIGEDYCVEETESECKLIGNMGRTSDIDPTCVSLTGTDCLLNNIHTEIGSEYCIGTDKECTQMNEAGNEQARADDTTNVCVAISSAAKCRNSTNHLVQDLGSDYCWGDQNICVNMVNDNKALNSSSNYTCVDLSTTYCRNTTDYTATLIITELCVDDNKFCHVMLADNMGRTSDIDPTCVSLTGTDCLLNNIHTEIGSEYCIGTDKECTQMNEAGNEQARADDTTNVCVAISSAAKCRNSTNHLVQDLGSDYCWGDQNICVNMVNDNKALNSSSNYTCVDLSTTYCRNTTDYTATLIITELCVDDNKFCHVMLADNMGRTSDIDPTCVSLTGTDCLLNNIHTEIGSEYCIGTDKECTQMNEAGNEQARADDTTNVCVAISSAAKCRNSTNHLVQDLGSDYCWGDQNICVNMVNDNKALNSSSNYTCVDLSTTYCRNTTDYTATLIITELCVDDNKFCHVMLADNMGRTSDIDPTCVSLTGTDCLLNNIHTEIGSEYCIGTDKECTQMNEAGNEQARADDTTNVCVAISSAAKCRNSTNHLVQDLGSDYCWGDQNTCVNMVNDNKALNSSSNYGCVDLSTTYCRNSTDYSATQIIGTLCVNDNNFCQNMIEESKGRSSDTNQTCVDLTSTDCLLNGVSTDIGSTYCINQTTKTCTQMNTLNSEQARSSQSSNICIDISTGNRHKCRNSNHIAEDLGETLCWGAEKMCVNMVEGSKAVNSATDFTCQELSTTHCRAEDTNIISIILSTMCVDEQLYCIIMNSNNINRASEESPVCEQQVPTTCIFNGESGVEIGETYCVNAGECISMSTTYGRSSLLDSTCVDISSPITPKCKYIRESVRDLEDIYCKGSNMECKHMEAGEVGYSTSTDYRCMELGDTKCRETVSHVAQTLEITECRNTAGDCVSMSSNNYGRESTTDPQCKSLGVGDCIHQTLHTNIGSIYCVGSNKECIAMESAGEEQGRLSISDNSCVDISATTGQTLCRNSSTYISTTMGSYELCQGDAHVCIYMVGTTYAFTSGTDKTCVTLSESQCKTHESKEVADTGVLSCIGGNYECVSVGGGFGYTGDSKSCRVRDAVTECVDGTSGVIHSLGDTLCLNTSNHKFLCQNMLSNNMGRGITSECIRLVKNSTCKNNTTHLPTPMTRDFCYSPGFTCENMITTQKAYISGSDRTCGELGETYCRNSSSLVRVLGGSGSNTCRRANDECLLDMSTHSSPYGLYRDTIHCMKLDGRHCLQAGNSRAIYMLDSVDDFCYASGTHTCVNLNTSEGGLIQGRASDTDKLCVEIGYTYCKLAEIQVRAYIGNIYCKSLSGHCKSLLSGFGRTSPSDNTCVPRISSTHCLDSDNVGQELDTNTCYKKEDEHCETVDNNLGWYSSSEKKCVELGSDKCKLGGVALPLLGGYCRNNIGECRSLEGEGLTRESTGACGGALDNTHCRDLGGGGG